MKNFQFLLNDVYLLKLHSDKGNDIDCFVTKISDTLNCYDDSDKFNFLCAKHIRYPSSITFRVYGDYVINKIKNFKHILVFMIEKMISSIMQRLNVYMIQGKIIRD